MNIYTYRLTARQYLRWTFIAAHLCEHAKAHAAENHFTGWEIVAPDGTRLDGNEGALAPGRN